MARKLEGITRGEVSKHPGHVFVPSGDVALTRALLARGAIRVISRLGKRVQQIGVAALPDAIESARAEVAATAESRAIARERGRERRAREEEQFRADFEREIRRLYPSIPDEDCRGVVAQTTEVSSGRVGRTAAAKDLREDPVRLSVRAWIRHAHTDYDQRLARAGIGRPFGRCSREDRKAARQAILPTVNEVAKRWAMPRAAGEPVVEKAVAPVVERVADRVAEREDKPALPRAAVPVKRAPKPVASKPAAPKPMASPAPGKRRPLWERPLG